MTTRNMLIVFIISITLLVDIGTSDSGKCGPDKLEMCAKPLMAWSEDGLAIPKTEDEVVTNCNTIKQSTKCIRGYINECTPSVVRQMGKLAMGSMKKAFDKRCSPEGIRNLLAHRDCLESFKSGGQACYRNMVVDMYRIKDAERAKLLPGVCCYLSRLHECNIAAVKGSCKEESQEYFGQESGKLMDELMEMLCPPSSRWGQPTCADLNATLPQASIPEGTNPSLIPLVFSLMERISENA